MKKNTFNKKKILAISFIIFSVIVAIFIIRYILMKDKISDPNKKYNLREDGFVLIKSIISQGEVDYIKKQCIENDHYSAKQYIINNSKIKNKLINSIGNPNYIFQDYILIIKKIKCTYMSSRL